MGGLYFALSQSEGLRLSPKGAQAIVVMNCESKHTKISHALIERH